MINLELKNMELVPAINFLAQMKLKASDSRCRNKLIKLLQEALKSLQESENELLEEFGQKDATGELIYESDGKSIQLKSGVRNEYLQERRQLLEEVSCIQGGTFSKNVKKMQTILYEYEEELSGIDAEIYDRLLDEYEKSDTEQ